MSRILMDSIWQPEQVLPYIFNELKTNIDAISPIQSIHLYGSRARVPVEDWHKITGKDWDIWVVCSFPIVNTRIWTSEKNYHIDLTISGMETAQEFFQYHKAIQLYPVNELELQNQP